MAAPQPLSRALRAPYVEPPDPLDRVRVAAGERARDVTAAALDRWRPWPALVFLVPGVLFGAVLSARPGAGSAVQLVALGLGWVTVGVMAAPRVAPPVFHRGDAPVPVPAVARAAWLVPLAYLVLALFTPAELMPHEAWLLGSIAVAGSWWLVGAAHLRDRRAIELLERLVSDRDDDGRASGDALWASTFVDDDDGTRTTTIPEDGARLRVGDVILGGGPDAEPRRYAERALAHHQRRMTAGLAAATAHTLATVAVILFS